MPQYNINLIWDPEAAVWIATCEDIPGLILESGSLDLLIERVRNAVPELLEIDGQKHQSMSMFFRSERYEEISV